jgi:hypothetical protein
MNPARVACVVEGKGEESAVPVLVRRVAALVNPAMHVDVPRPVLVHRNRVGEKFADLERAIERAVASIQLPGGLFFLLDADDDEDCPARLGPVLRERVRALRGDLPLAVVLAKREYEAWFLAAAESLRGKRGLPADLEAPPNPEDIRNAKGWLRDRTPAERKYSPTDDQAALTAVFNFDLARQGSPSFDKCWRELHGLLTTLDELPNPQPPSPE